MTDLIEYDDDLTEDVSGGASSYNRSSYDKVRRDEPFNFTEPDRSWPYLADRGLSEALADLLKMQDSPMSEAEADAVEQAITAIELLFEKATYRDGFRFFSKDD